MTEHKFLSLPTELVGVAVAAYDYFRLHGYRVRADYTEPTFPRVPALLCRRGHETLIVEIGTKWRHETLELWLAYARSRSSDTRLCLVSPETAKLSNAILGFVTKNKIGVLRVNGQPTQMLETADLAMNIHLPALASLPPPVRRTMAPVYGKWNSDWRDALDDACQALEVESRKYLSAGVASGRVTIMGENGQLKNVTSSQIKKMTLGILAATFRNIVSKTAKDAVIGNALTQINPERVGLAHNKPSKAVERRLRRNAGTHMWSIINCLKQMASK